MIKVFADKVLAFTQGEKDSHGALVRVKTQIGFCSLPDWVENDDYYKAAVADGSLKPFISAAESREIEKGAEKVAALKAEIEDLEARKKTMSTDGVDVKENPIDKPRTKKERQINE